MNRCGGRSPPDFPVSSPSAKDNIGSSPALANVSLLGIGLHEPEDADVAPTREYGEESPYASVSAVVGPFGPPTWRCRRLTTR